jgi:hypothetical protein
MNPDNGLGPPGKERPGASHDAEPNQQLADTTPATIDDNRPGRQTPYDALAGNRRRRRFAASRRMPPIPTCVCGRCVRDPFVDRPRCGDEIGDHMAEAAAAAVALLDQLGTPGLLDRRTCAAMWRIGHRRLAEAVHRRTAGAA